MNYLKRSLILFALAFSFLGVTAPAQSTEMLLNVNVPFGFSIGNKTFSAGQYSVVRAAPRILFLKDSRGSFLASMLTNTTQSFTPRNSSVLKFRNEGGRFVLVEVWEEGATVGFELYHYKQSPALAKNSGGDTQIAAQNSLSNR